MKPAKKRSHIFPCCAASPSVSNGIFDGQSALDKLSQAIEKGASSKTPSLASSFEVIYVSPEANIGIDHEDGVVLAFTAITTPFDEDPDMQPKTYLRLKNGHLLIKWVKDDLFHKLVCAMDETSHSYNIHYIYGDETLNVSSPYSCIYLIKSTSEDINYANWLDMIAKGNAYSVNYSDVRGLKLLLSFK